MIPRPCRNDRRRLFKGSQSIPCISPQTEVAQLAILAWIAERCTIWPFVAIRAGTERGGEAVGQEHMNHLQHPPTLPFCILTFILPACVFLNGGIPHSRLFHYFSRKQIGNQEHSDCTIQVAWSLAHLPQEVPCSVYTSVLTDLQGNMPLAPTFFCPEQMQHAFSQYVV